MIKNPLFTIGHSTHTTKHFIALLQKHSVQVVCDVRSQPYSKYNSQFNKENVEKNLKQYGIAYLFLGMELGGRSEDPSYYANGKLQYKLLSKSSLFQKGLKRLIEGVENHNIALMCSESDPLMCHRTILVCRELCEKVSFFENHILHILPDASIQTHKEIERNLLEKLRISPDMLRSEKECIEEAYCRQAQKISYVKKEIKDSTVFLEESRSEDFLS